MKKIFAFCLLAMTLLAFVSCNKRSGKPRVLLFTKTTGFRHSSIPNGKTAILKLGAENGFVVDTTEDASYFNEDSLKNYSAVIFLHTTGDLLNNYQEADFERYIQAGGGYAGIHAASDAEYDWGWYGRLVGGYFESHPKPQEAKLLVQDSTHISTLHLPREWIRTDEWYNFKNLNPDVHVLISIDEKSYEGGKNGDHHPMAWYHDYDGGRAWYTELGHTEASFTEENYLKHILGGIQYAIGDNKKLNYNQATTLRVPEEDRFVKVPLVQATFFEPTEMTILPNLDVLIAQRRGEFMLYKNSDHSVRQAGKLDVYWKTHTPAANAEEGLLGLQADPDFEKNHFVYVFYSPADSSVNRLSRFTFENDTLKPGSEKIILQFYSQREICCHTGGSIAFGPNHTLFVSTGDNSTPFDEPGQPYVNHGFGPIDDRPGHEQYDARRSSSNSNDLRGKILRIQVKPDGSYSIPEGNLFPPGTPKTRSEIYVMGNRNPYRISVDPKNSFLYWGEVGPDASADSLDSRGPQGYDELNQAKKAGYFGWPLFVGNNYPYHNYDYSSGQSGPAFDPAKPINNSRNNTGITELPPVSPAFIWYPYGNSKEFPQMGTGGRTAMAGPVYYAERYPKSSRMPEYYNGKLFIYEWMRNFIKAVTLKPNGDFDKMEPFMAGTKLNAVIDMEMGPDGKLYLLEYGNGWFLKNADAGLSRIDFISGNRAPKIAGIQVNRNSGALPFTVKLTVDAKDPERDPLTYRWHIGKDIVQETKVPELEYKLEKAGDYSIYSEVMDDKNAVSQSNSLSVYAGNETPEVSIRVKGNQSFYFPGKPVSYEVQVTDKDDSSSQIDPENLVVTAEFMQGRDRSASSTGHLQLSDATIGKNLVATLDCKNCHKPDIKSIGPAFVDVATKYASDPNSEEYLINKIIKGGSGVWGEVAMAAHPNLEKADAKLLVAYIRSLGGGGKQKSLPASGKIPVPDGKSGNKAGYLVIRASYTDHGGNNIRPMTGSGDYSMESNQLLFYGVKNFKDFMSVDFNGMRFMVLPKSSGWFSIDSLDLSEISGASIAAGWQAAPKFGYRLEIHLDTPDGRKLAEGILPGGMSTNGKMGGTRIGFKWDPVTDGKKHSLYVVSTPLDPKEPGQAGLQMIEFISR